MFQGFCVLKTMPLLIFSIWLPSAEIFWLGSFLLHGPLQTTETLLLSPAFGGRTACIQWSCLSLLCCKAGNFCYRHGPPQQSKFLQRNSLLWPLQPQSFNTIKMDAKMKDSKPVFSHLLFMSSTSVWNTLYRLVLS